MKISTVEVMKIEIGVIDNGFVIISDVLTAGGGSMTTQIAKDPDSAIKVVNTVTEKHLPQLYRKLCRKGK